MYEVPTAFSVLSICWASPIGLTSCVCAHVYVQCAVCAYMCVQECSGYSQLTGIHRIHRACSSGLTIWLWWDLHCYPLNTKIWLWHLPFTKKGSISKSCKDHARPSEFCCLPGWWPHSPMPVKPWGAGDKAGTAAMHQVLDSSLSTGSTHACCRLSAYPHCPTKISHINDCYPLSTEDNSRG